jgi:hypothetical protein
MSDGSDPERGAEDATRPAAPYQPGRGTTKPRKQDWIGNQLRRVYDEALREAIPEDMLKLLDRLDGSAEKPK